MLYDRRAKLKRVALSGPGPLDSQVLLGNGARPVQSEVPTGLSFAAPDPAGFPGRRASLTRYRSASCSLSPSANEGARKPPKKRSPHVWQYMRRSTRAHFATVTRLRPEAPDRASIVSELRGYGRAPRVKTGPYTVDVPEEEVSSQPRHLNVGVLSGSLYC